jgi:FlaA1/EpsC-like NDP-sugar epimerase
MKNLLKRKLLNSNVPRWVVLAIDIYIIANTFILAYLIRFNFNFNFDASKLRVQLPLVIAIALVSFLITGSYRGIIRHTGYKDTLKIIEASTLILVVLIVLVITNRTFNLVTNFTIPVSILMIHYLLNLVVLIASRFVYKAIYYLIILDVKRKKSILIYGAGESGLITHSVLKKDAKSNVKIIGFIDADKDKWGKVLDGIPIFNPAKITKEFIENKNVEEIIVSIQKIPSTQLMKIVDKFNGMPVKVKIVPPVEDWINNDLNVHQIKDIKIEDLLGREPIKLDNPILENEFNNKNILITGAAGSIGSEIARQVAHFNYKQLILIDQAESDLYNLQQYFWNKEIKNFTVIVGDVRNKQRMEEVFDAYKPNLVFHAAAYKHVPLMEAYPMEAIGVNIKGTKIIADISVAYNVEKFVMISTDKAVNPTNVMGATKRIAEMYINCLNTLEKTKFITTRFGNVLGSNGSVIPLFESQIKKGGPITLTDMNITRYFMTIPEACQLVLEAGIMGHGGEIYVFDMGKSIKIYDLALKMIQLSGLKYPDDIDIKIVGLRPGEKIKEELLADGENTIKTHHKKIRIAKIREIDREWVKQKIEDLCSNSPAYTLDENVIKIKEIIPEYVSNNSIFEALDKPIKIKAIK